jgi:hypothetical protein
MCATRLRGCFEGRDEPDSQPWGRVALDPTPDVMAANRDGDGRNARGSAELGTDGGNMVGGSATTNPECRHDLPVGVPLNQETQVLSLAPDFWPDASEGPGPYCRHRRQRICSRIGANSLNPLNFRTLRGEGHPGIRARTPGPSTFPSFQPGLQVAGGDTPLIPETSPMLGSLEM